MWNINKSLDGLSERQKRRLMDKSRGGTYPEFIDMWPLIVFFSFILSCGVLGIIMSI